jgi:hypothetical protein
MPTSRDVRVVRVQDKLRSWWRMVDEPAYVLEHEFVTRDIVTKRNFGLLNHARKLPSTSPFDVARTRHVFGTIVIHSSYECVNVIPSFLLHIRGQSGIGGIRGNASERCQRFFGLRHQRRVDFSQIRKQLGDSIHGERVESHKMHLVRMDRIGIIRAHP